MKTIVTPTVDVFENGEEYLFVADVPGVTPDGLKVQLESDTLTFTGHTEAFDYRRAFTLPTSVDADAAQADLKAGVLTLKLPKAKAARNHTIAIKAS
jgi:HSP20 family molecular chaperone IbpA